MRNQAADPNDRGSQGGQGSYMRVLPSNLVLFRRRNLVSLRAFAFGLVTALTVGCAKFPATGGNQNTHLIFTMRVAGHIRNGTQAGEPTPYIYMVAVYPSTDLFPTVQGPVPVITAPWGNGMVAGNATHFIR